MISINYREKRPKVKFFTELFHVRHGFRHPERRAAFRRRTGKRS